MGTFNNKNGGAMLGELGERVKLIVVVKAAGDH